MDSWREKNVFKPIVIILNLCFRKIILMTVENMHGVCQETRCLIGKLGWYFRDQRKW